MVVCLDNLLHSVCLRGNQRNVIRNHSPREQPSARQIFFLESLFSYSTFVSAIQMFSKADLVLKFTFTHKQGLITSNINPDSISRSRHLGKPSNLHPLKLLPPFLRPEKECCFPSSSLPRSQARFLFLPRLREKPKHG